MNVFFLFPSSIQILAHLCFPLPDFCFTPSLFENHFLLESGLWIIHFCTVGELECQCHHVRKFLSHHRKNAQVLIASLCDPGTPHGLLIMPNVSSPEKLTHKLVSSTLQWRGENVLVIFSSVSFVSFHSFLLELGQLHYLYPTSLPLWFSFHAESTELHVYVFSFWNIGLLCSQLIVILSLVSRGSGHLR